jgi:hypothetical protein
VISLDGQHDLASVLDENERLKRRTLSATTGTAASLSACCTMNERGLGAKDVPIQL